SVVSCVLAEVSSCWKTVRNKWHLAHHLLQSTNGRLEFQGIDRESSQLNQHARPRRPQNKNIFRTIPRGEPYHWLNVTILVTPICITVDSHRPPLAKCL